MCNKWEKISHSHTNHIYTEVKYLVVYLVYIKDTKSVSQSLIRFVHLFLLKEASLLKTFCPMSRWDQNKILQQAVSVACNWSLTTLWLIDELSWSAPVYKHPSSERLAGRHSTTVVQTKHAAVMFSKTMVKGYGVMQIKLWLQTHLVWITSFV